MSDSEIFRNTRKPFLYTVGEGWEAKEGDFVADYNGFYWCNSQKQLQPLNQVGNVLEIAAREDVVDALDYYSDVIKRGKWLGISVVVLLSKGDATIKSLSDYNYSRIQTIKVEHALLVVCANNKSWPLIVNTIIAETSLNELVENMFEPFVTSLVVCDPNASTARFLLYNVSVHIDIFSKTYSIGDTHVTTNSQEVMWFINGPVSEVEQLVWELELLRLGREVKRSLPGTRISETTLQVFPQPANRYQSKDCHRTISDICIALHCLELPKYVLLEIIDWLPSMQHHGHRKKIDLIFSVVESCSKITLARK